MLYKVILKRAGFTIAETADIIILFGGKVEDARRLAETAPQVLFENLIQERAITICQGFMRIGCEVVMEDENGQIVPVQAPDAVECFRVVLEQVGNEQIQTIKEVREATGLGLKDAKDMVDNAPVTIMSGLKIEKANEIKTRLEALGNTASVSNTMENMRIVPNQMLDIGGTTASKRCPRCNGFNVFDAAPGIWGKLKQKIAKTNYTYKCDDCGNQW